LLTHYLLANPGPLPGECRRHPVPGGHAGQEVTQAALAVPPGLPEGDADRIAGGAGEGGTR
jgi:hypothetical protein